MVLAIIYLFIWYLQAGTSERSYKVISETGTVTTNSPVTAPETEVGESGVSITIVDRTGADSVIESIVMQLTEQGYVINGLLTEQKEERTVIVFSGSNKKSFRAK